MKKIYKLVLPLLFVSIILPNLAFASWWNPFSWNIFSWFHKSVKTNVVELSTSTITSVSSTTNSTVAKPVIDNSAVINAQVDAQVKATLKAKADEDAKIAQQELDKQKAEQDAINLAAQQAQQQTVIQNQAKYNQLNQLNNELESINNTYQSMVNTINQQISNTKTQYIKDIQTAQYAGDTVDYSIGLQNQVTQQANVKIAQLQTQLNSVMSEWKQKYDQNKMEFDQIKSSIK